MSSREALRTLRSRWICGQEVTYLQRWPDGRRLLYRVRLASLRSSQALFSVLTRERDFDVEHQVGIDWSEEGWFPQHLSARIQRGPVRGSRREPSDHVVMVQNLLHDAIRAHALAADEPVAAPENRLGLREVYAYEKDLASVLASRHRFRLSPHVPLLGVLRMEVVTAKPPAGSDLRVLGDDGRPLVLAEGEVASSIELVAFSLASGTPGRDLLPDFAGAQALDYGGVALAMPRTWIPRRRAIATDRFDPAFAPWFLFQTIAPSCSLAWSLGYYEGTVAEVEARLEWVTALVHGLGEIEERRMLGDPDGLALVLRPEPREGKVPLEVACIRTRTDRRALIDLRVSLGIAADHPRREAYEKAVRKVAWRAIDGLAFVGS